MQVQLTPDQESFLLEAVKSGRYSRPEEAFEEAFSLWVERERNRAEIIAAIEIAEISLLNGGGRVITEASMRELAEDVKRRGRERLATERKSA